MSETESLSKLLRQGTAECHRRAEGATFVSRYTQGGLTRADHARHLRALHGIYRSLEEALDRHRQDRRVGEFHLPGLWRTSAIEGDLEVLLGPAWRDVDPVAASVEYEHRLHRFADTDPIRLVAHAYVRYLGDLSGGQILKVMAAKALDLGPEALSFYEFPRITDIAAAKTDFRQRLDGLQVDAEERQALVAEAVRAFELNGAVFTQLEAARA